MYPNLKIAMTVCAIWVNTANFAESASFADLGPSVLKAATNQESKDSKVFASRIERLTSARLGTLPALVRDSEAPVLIVETDQGGYCRLLTVMARRRPPGTKGEGLQVAVFEKLDCFESGAKQARRTASTKDLMLFDQFEIDLDSGTIVPAGQGGDLRFVVQGADGPRLEPVNSAKLYGLEKLPPTLVDGKPRPSPGRKVIAADFAGVYQLQANGQFAGRLTLEIRADGVVSGSLLSDKNGASYPVEGKISIQIPHQIVFQVSLPQTRQEFEGYLWTDGKSAIAGKFTFLDRPYGFYAIRED